jgi:DNA-binding SARP family transcriptional activator/tetratricopeptide (TPR) repeat protein
VRPPDTGEAAMPSVKVQLFGGFEARLASGAAVRLPMKKAQALLAYLGARPGQSHPRDKLAALLWGEKSDEHARGGLRHALVALRAALANSHPSPLRIEGQTLALNPRAVETDVAMFEQRVAEGTRQALERAAGLYRGDLLLGFTVDEPLFEQWLVAERERLREMAVGALTRLLAEQSKAASTQHAIQTAMRLLALDPLQENVHRTLMRLYARQGRRGAALKQYEVCVGALQRELGTKPEAETGQVYRELLTRPAELEDARADHRSLSAQKAGPPPPDLPEAETPLFGREAELARLRELLGDAVRGHGHVATVVGEAGIGKTRLISTLAADALVQRCRVLIGRCHESDSILSFGPWVDACRSGAISVDEEILGALHPTRRAELTRLLPEAGRAGLPPASNSALPLFESVADLVERVAVRHPLVLVLEDMHWADEMSLRLLSFVSRRVAAWRALVLMTARDEELDASSARRTLQALTAGPHATSITLSPLSRANIALLVHALARVGTGTESMARMQDHIWAMSEGNPFVAVEAMRALGHTPPCEGGNGTSNAPTLPASVRDLVAQRLDRLSGRSQELVAAAAVIGRRFDFSLLVSVGRVDERDVAAAVEEMVRQHVLQAVGHQLEFIHDRVRDVAYGRLLPPRRRLLHRAVVEALETAPLSNRPHDDIEQVAHHALRGELREKAVHYLRQAGEKAAARSALADARVWFEQALGALEALPESRSVLEEAFEVRLALRPVLMQLVEFQRCLEVLREAEALADRLDDDGRRGRVGVFLAHMHTRLDDPDTGLVHGRRSLEIAARLGDLRLRILATSFLGHAHFMRGEYTRAVELATANLAALPPDWVHELLGNAQPPAVNDRSRLIVCLSHLGRFAEALPHEAELIRLAEAIPHAYSRSVAYHGASQLHFIKGDWTKAHALIERQIEALRTANIADELPHALGYSARALAHVGDANAALSRLREGQRLLADQAPRRKTGTGFIYVALGRACFDLGLLDEAERLADRSAAPALTRVDFVPFGLCLLGDIATHPDRFDAERGAAHYRAALALAESRGMRPLVAHCHLGLGKLCRRTDKREQAQEHLTTATTMYREMGMTYWLEKAEAEELGR